MNENKLKRLFAAARKDAAPAPPAEFAADVLRAVRREPAVRPPPAATVFDQLNRWFPRLALAAAAIILLCLAADYGLGSTGVSELADDNNQMSTQFDPSADQL